jgi:hypothetical protein
MDLIITALKKHHESKRRIMFDVIAVLKKGKKKKNMNRETFVIVEKTNLKFYEIFNSFQIK